MLVLRVQFVAFRNFSCKFLCYVCELIFWCLCVDFVVCMCGFCVSCVDCVDFVFRVWIVWILCLVVCVSGFCVSCV